MFPFPFGYERIPANSWAYLSALLMLALFFKFNRFWTLRNLDLILLLLLSPGLLMVFHQEELKETNQAPAVASNARDGSVIATPDADTSKSDNEVGKSTGESAGELDETAPESTGELPSRPTDEAANDAVQDSTSPTPAGQDDSQGAEAKSTDTVEPTPENELSRSDWIRRSGFVWLFSIGVLLLIRMMLDPLMARRPLLEPNLTTGGLVFLGISMLVVSIANMVITKPGREELKGAESGLRLVHRVAAEEEEKLQLNEFGPGYALFHALVVQTVSSELEWVAKSLAIFGQVMLVLGLVFIGHYHFNNFRIGVGIAVIYLMLPYTSLFSGHVMHVLPAALIVWAIALYRRPFWSGVMIGLAGGVSYYPVFLLPLWISFYWERGWRRFVTGAVTALIIGVGGLIFTSATIGDFFAQLQRMFGFWAPRLEGLSGIWSLGWDAWFRLPIMVAFFVLSISFIFWPTRKNVAALIAYTAAVMVSVQFWHGYEGGTHMAWYLPLCLVVFFRPNLSERYAETEIRESTRRRIRIDDGESIAATT
jgi:hypothetical protein